MATIFKSPNGKVMKEAGGKVLTECCCAPCGEYSLSIDVDPQSCCCFEFSFSIDPAEATTIVSQEWDFGDGATSTDAAPEHCYDESGTYLVELTTTDSEGCVKHSQAEVTCVCETEEEPVADFSYEQTDGDPCCFEFTDESVATCPERTISEWLWDFGDGNTSTAQNPTHCYTGDGPWDVTLTVTDSAGCESEPVVMEVVCYPPSNGCCTQLPFLPPTVTVILPTPSTPIATCYCPSLPGSHVLNQTAPGSCLYEKSFSCDDGGTMRTITIQAVISNSRSIRILAVPGLSPFQSPEWDDTLDCSRGTFVLTRSQATTLYICNYTVADTPTATLIVP